MLGSGSASAQAPTGFSLASAASSVAATLAKPAVAVTTAVRLGNGSIVQAQPAQSVTLSLTPNVATEAAWLRGAGWPLYALVDRFGTGGALNEQENCMAVAVYHEARGESLEGQVAVARVIMNRAASGKYPGTWCEVVKQPWQFSFVNPRAGRSNSLLLALLTYLVYSNAMSVCQAWIAQGRLSFGVALLLPHLVVVMVLALMFHKRLAVSPFWRARA